MNITRILILTRHDNGTLPASWWTGFGRSYGANTVVVNPLLRESRPGQKWPWRHTESVNGTFTKVTQLALPSSKFLFPVNHRGYQNSTLPEISPWVSIKFPNSSPFLLVNTPHWEGAASPIKTFHFQVSLSSILQMTHPLALMLLKSARFCNHF